MFVARTQHSFSLSTCVHHLSSLPTPCYALTGIAFFTLFFFKRYKALEIHSAHLDRLFNEGHCQQALDYAQNQNYRELFKQVSFSDCDRDTRVKAFGFYSNNFVDAIIYDMAMDALQRNSCKELTVSQWISSDRQFSPLMSLWRKKAEKGLCQESYPKKSEEVEANLRIRGKVYKHFEAFKKYYSENDWIGVARNANHMRWSDPFALSKQQREEVSAGLKQLLNQDDVSLGLKEYVYHQILKTCSAFVPDDMPAVTENLKNQFLEKGDLIRAERIMSTV